MWGGTLLQYSFQDNPKDGGAWWATVHGVAKSETQLNMHTLKFWAVWCSFKWVFIDTETNNKLIFKLYLPGQELEIVKSCWWIQWNNEDSGVSTGNCVCVCMVSQFSHVQLFVTLWTIAHQAPLSMGFSRQKYWSELPCPPPEDFPHPGIEPCLLFLRHWQAVSFPLAHLGSIVAVLAQLLSTLFLLP